MLGTCASDKDITLQFLDRCSASERAIVYRFLKLIQVFNICFHKIRPPATESPSFITSAAAGLADDTAKQVRGPILAHPLLFGEVLNDKFFTPTTASTPSCVFCQLSP